jgi:hypothetical protein
VTVDDRAADCGRLVVREGGVQLRVSEDGAAGLAGLSVCARVHTCPVCSGRILAVRTGDVQAAIARWLQLHPEGAVGMCTLTVKHGPRAQLARLLDGMGAAYARMSRSREYREARQRATWAHQIRAFEARWGSVNGWHPHFHTLIFFEQTPSAETLKDLCGKVFGAWRAACKVEGLKAGIRAQDLRLFSGNTEQIAKNAGAYVAKNYYSASLSESAERALSLALEVTRGDLKASRSLDAPTLAPFELLTALVRDLEVSGGDRDTPTARLMVRRWNEWERATKGRRAHYWSRGLRSLLGLDQVLTDDEAASEETGTKEDAVLELWGEGWRKLAARRDGAVGLLEATESGFRASGRPGAHAAATAFLRAAGIAWRAPEKPVLRPPTLTVRRTESPPG